MRRRFALFSLLIAWLLATGSHWDLLQTYAWARMFVGYAQTLSLGEAVRQTFDPDKPCEICLSVKRAKQHDNGAPPPESKLRDKIDLVYQPSPTVLAFVPEANRWDNLGCRPISVERPAPPVPPPRGIS